MATFVYHFAWFDAFILGAIATLILASLWGQTKA
ncbi:hypothetical protein SAMN05892877_10721 [Rhizobium subbaraonis]|uniref:Uncharacterized protein n=1 Tax=Rhizobium subbaraonis TaxID=908946 RepID=A0A285UEN4_9HYPH|nr:hypothetical protein SAMN05892877_10721 [Rhizobium subbaraonis]